MQLFSRVFIACATLVFASAYFFIAPPFPYPEGNIVIIPAGATARQAGEVLYTAGATHSTEAFIAVTKFFGDSGVRAGAYLLSRPENVFQLSYRLTHGVSKLTQTKVTVPEGLSSREIGIIFAGALPGFNVPEFDDRARLLEGYLFPDTYFFLPGDSPQTVIEKLHATYLEKTRSLKEEIFASGHSEEEIVTMASILEEEANDPESRRVVSGILWKRIKAHIPLQVDAVFGYILGKSGYAPTASDLKVDSPYNTYLHQGLPPGPISNPGLDAIKAALEPTATPYLYYLTGSDGEMYYAKTFAEHIANQKHLK